MSDSLQFHGLWPPPGSSAHGDSPGKNPGVCFYALLQGIFPTQGSNLGLPHSRQILYCLSHQGSPGVKTIDLTIWTFVGKVMSMFFNMLYRLVIAFLPRSKHLLISWLQSLSTLILEAKGWGEICHYFHFPPIYLPWTDGDRYHDLSILNVEC